MSVKKIIFIAFGSICFALGTVGVVLTVCRIKSSRAGFFYIVNAQDNPSEKTTQSR